MKAANTKLKGGKEIIKTLTEEKERIQLCIDKHYENARKEESIGEDYEAILSNLEEAISCLESCF